MAREITQEKSVSPAFPLCPGSASPTRRALQDPWGNQGSQGNPLVLLLSGGPETVSTRHRWPHSQVLGPSGARQESANRPDHGFKARGRDTGFRTGRQALQSVLRWHRSQAPHSATPTLILGPRSQSRPAADA